jgi:hypothetical protein
MDQGFGQGRNENYKAWIPITRGLSSPKSNLFVAKVPICDRGINLLSADEYKTTLVAGWLGAAEIRDQFPLWPETFVHPMAGLWPGRDCRLPRPPGLIEIARDAGIDHGTYVGGDVPFVATTDLVVRVGEPPNDRLVFWSCKPLELMVRGKGATRVLERLELERRYAGAINAEHRVINAGDFEPNLIGNLDWLTPRKSELNRAQSDVRFDEFVGAFIASDDGRALKECIARAGRVARLDAERTQEYFRISAWLGRIDLDLTVDLVMSRRPVRDHSRVRTQMRRSLLGESK